MEFFGTYNPIRCTTPRLRVYVHLLTMIPKGQWCSAVHQWRDPLSGVTTYHFEAVYSGEGCNTVSICKDIIQDVKAKSKLADVRHRCSAVLTFSLQKHQSCALPLRHTFSSWNCNSVQEQLWRVNNRMALGKPPSYSKDSCHGLRNSSEALTNGNGHVQPEGWVPFASHFQVASWTTMKARDSVGENTKLDDIRVG